MDAKQFFESKRITSVMHFYRLNICTRLAIFDLMEDYHQYKLTQMDRLSRCPECKSTDIYQFNKHEDKCRECGCQFNIYPNN